MKKSILFLLCLLITISLSAEISLESYQGYVQIKASEKSAWLSPKSGQKLQPGFIIYTGFNSSAIIRTDDSKIEVKPLTQMSISALLKTKNKISTEVYLKYGKVKANVSSPQEVQTIFKVRSANSTASVRGTIFYFGNDTLIVEDGIVQLLSDDGFSMLLMDGDKAYAPKMDFIVSPVEQKEGEAFVSILPIGMSDLEMGNMDGFGDSKTGGQAKVVIKINIVK